MKSLFDQYLGKIVTVASRQVRSGKLALVADEYFGIQDTRSGTNYYVPYTAILDVAEVKDKNGETQLRIALQHSR